MAMNARGVVTEKVKLKCSTSGDFIYHWRDYVTLAKYDIAYVPSLSAIVNDYSFGKTFISSTQPFRKKKCSTMPICRHDV